MIWVILVVILILLGLRSLLVIPQFGLSGSSGKNLKDKSLMVLLGSGGHTGEMLRLMETVDKSQLKQVQWIISSGDTTSATRLKSFLQNSTFKSEIVELKRARNVGESISSSIKSTLMSLKETFALFISSNKPDVLIINGPGTAVPLCYISTLLNYLFLSNTKIIYIESLARVNGLSVSGKLCYPLAHKFLVQWEPIHKLYPRSEYYGVLV